jgi:hypothetical protein
LQLGQSTVGRVAKFTPQALSHTLGAVIDGNLRNLRGDLCPKWLFETAGLGPAFA